MLRVTSQAVTSENSTASALSASIMLRAVAYSASTWAPASSISSCWCVIRFSSAAM